MSIDDGLNEYPLPVDEGVRIGHLPDGCQRNDGDDARKRYDAAFRRLSHVWTGDDGSEPERNGGGFPNWLPLNVKYYGHVYKEKRL